MNYGQIFDCDTANGPGIRASLFVSGCPHHCPGCFNQETWDFDYGLPYTAETQNLLLQKLAPGHVAGLTLLGGEPLDPRNVPELLPTVQAFRERFPHKTLWVYSGYTWEQLLARLAQGEEPLRKLLHLTDVLVDGPFVLAQKNISLPFRGSANQRILDVPASLRAGAARWVAAYAPKESLP